MAVTKITWENKTGIQNDASVARKNKVTDEDMNEIKQTVNNNADEVSAIQEDIEDLQGGQGTANTDITSLKNRVTTLETDNTQNKSDISTLKSDNQTNKSNISTMQGQISDIQQEQQTQNKNIEELQENDTNQDELISKLKQALLNAETEEAKSLHVTDANKFGILEVLGNHEQKTRSGKNLLDFSGLSTQTVNGLTITNNNDGSITLNGTTTDIVSMKLNQTMHNLVAGNYYLSRNSSGTASGTFTNILYGNNGTAVNVANLTSEGMPLTTTTDYEEYYLWLYITSGITFTNYTIKPQLEAGTVKTDWEQYGAMPSPNYPSEIKCLGSNKNLFDDSEYKGVKIETSFKNNSIPITLDGEGYYNSKVYFTDGTVIEAGDWNMPISLQDEEYNQVVGLRPQTATLITKEQIANIKNARLIYNTTGISTYQGKIIKGIKIEKQETENASPTSYSPYRARQCRNKNK